MKGEEHYLPLFTVTVAVVESVAPSESTTVNLQDDKFSKLVNTVIYHDCYIIFEYIKI